MIKRVLLVGYGRFGRHHFRNLLSLGVLHAVVDSDPAVLASLPCRTSTQWQDFIDEVDAIDICSPPESHLHYCKLALERNKHIFVEKPLVMGSMQLDSLGPVEEYGRTFMVGSIYDFVPEMVALRNCEANEVSCTLIRPERDRSSDLLSELGWHPIDWAVKKYGILTRCTASGTRHRMAINLEFGSNRVHITIARDSVSKTEFLVGDSKFVDGKLLIHGIERVVPSVEPLAKELACFIRDHRNDFKEAKATTHVIDRIRDSYQESPQNARSTGE